MPSIRDIAKSANVSVGTVSRVLNNQPNVSSASRSKVLRAINTMRDSTAVGSRKATASIALVYRGQSSLHSTFDAAVMHGIAEGLNQTDHDLMVINAARSRGQGESLGQMLLRRGVAGALLRTTTLTHGMCEELAEEGFPAVAIADRIDDERIGCVFGDTHSAIERALEHLVHLGHSKIAIALNVVDDFDHAQRLNTYQRFLNEAGLPTDERWIVRSAARQPSGGAALRQIMTLADRPTAVFMSDPPLGAGLCIEALRMGVEIPRDLSIIGFDDTFDRYGTFPQLSSVCQDAQMLGRKAIQHLLEIISHESAPKQIRLACCFEPLESTAPPLDET
jgi:LacI family transcriptional regulator